MDECKLATIFSDVKLWPAIIGFFGGIAGALFTIFGYILRDWLKNLPQKKLDNSRKDILKTMLKDERFPNRWRKLDTLSRVIGADEETTKRLLIEAKARGSEKEDCFWGLIENHPFNETDV